MPFVNKTYANIARDKNREDFRDAFDARLIGTHGDVNVVAASCEVTRQTVHVWRQRNGSLPDLYQIKKLADSRKQSAAWLAYNIGPRDPELLDMAVRIASELESDHDFRSLINAYKKTRPSARPLLSQLASELALSAIPAPAPAPLPAQSPLQPAPAKTLAELVQDMIAEIGKLDPASPQSKAFASVAKQLNRLSVLPTAQSPALSTTHALPPVATNVSAAGKTGSPP